MTRRLLALAGVLTLVLGSALALNDLVVPGLWLPRTLVCVGAAALVSTVARSRTVSAGIPSLLGLLAGLLAASAVFFQDEAMLGVLPTQATLRAVGEQLPLALEQMRASYPPITAGDGIALVAAVGVLVVFVLTEMLAVGAWAPAWAGLPVLGLWCVPILLGSPVNPLVLVVSGVAYVLVIATQARDDARFRRRPDARAARATTAVVTSVIVVAFVVAPALLRIPVPFRWHPFYELVGSSSTRLDLGLGLREDLTRSTDTPLFTYTGSEPAQVGPLHAYTRSTFDGNEWTAGPGGELVPADGQVLWPTSTEGLTLADSFGIEIAVNHLGQDRLLLPSEPRRVVAGVGTEYLASSDEVVAYVGGQITYDLEIMPRVLDEERLSQLRPPADVEPSLLEVPDTGYQSDIADLARQVVTEAGAGSEYEQLVAIQNWLRSPSNFVYSTTIADPETPDAVWDFLNDRHGYCVQFATAMIVMARTLGIPARLAVGFLPGEARQDGVVEVTAHDAHAWPQVLFEDVGWVRFEPTPDVQAGPPPPYAAESASTPTAEASSSVPTDVPTAAEAPSESASAETGGTSAEQEERTRTTWWLVLAGLLLVAALASVLVGRRARLKGRDLRERWAHVLTYLHRVGIETSPSSTPRTVLRDAAGVLDADALGALSRLVDAVERSSYARDDAPAPSREEVDEWVDQVLEGVRAVMRAERRERIGV